MLLIFVNNYYMKKIYIYNFFDVFFRIIIVFLLSFIWIRYFVYSLWLCVVLSSVVTGVIEIGVQIIQKRRRKIQKISKDEKQKIENMINYFVFSSKAKVLDFFFNLAKSKHEATRKNEYILVGNAVQKVALVPCFLVNDLSEQNVIDIFLKVEKENLKRLVICTKSVSNNTSIMAKNLPLDIVILNGEETYFELVKKYNIFPPKIQLKIQKKYTFSDFISSLLNKSRTKGYFYLAIVILFGSFFSTFKIYYLIMSSVLLVLAFASFSNVRYNPKRKREIL